VQNKNDTPISLSPLTFTLSSRMPNSFPPIARPDARVLILGSMPGVASLNAFEYYKHPRNAFWFIMGELYGAHRTLPYLERLEKLQDAGIALWDVLESCEREGSLDSDIIPESIVVNDIPRLIKTLPSLELIATNGGTASQLFKRYVKRPPHIRWVQLPSSSPANARVTMQDKLMAWSELLHLDSEHKRSSRLVQNE
jgi:double-stranded uracil-DNA glycosylase